MIVRNDDHNTFDHVAHTLAPHPGRVRRQGYAIADLIHNTGQAIVWSGMKEPAELYWEQLNDAGLTMAPLEQGLAARRRCAQLAGDPRVEPL